jgi:uncharacterized protein (DUF1778 family)
MLKSKGNINVDNVLSLGYSRLGMTQKKHRRTKAATMVRFDSEQQKKKLEEVASNRRQSLNQFLLTAAEALAKQTTEKAS